MRRLALIMALGLALAACSGADAGSDVAPASDGGEVAGGGVATTFAASEQAPEEERGSGAIAVDIGLVQDRRVVRNAQLQLEADDTRAALDRIIALTEAAGGFVADATVNPVQDPEDQPSASMTLRIPSSKLTRVMDSIKDSVEKVVSESQTADDVTDQFIDLEARLTNLEALEVELRALLTEVRQQPEADPDKLLRVFNEIANVRGQIEQIQGQLRFLNDQVAESTLRVSSRERNAPAPAAVAVVDNPDLGSSVDLSIAPNVPAYVERYDARPERYGPPAPPDPFRDRKRTGHHAEPDGQTAATVYSPAKVDNELYVRDYSKCILCYKCVHACGEQYQNTFAIAVAGRGFDARISTEYVVELAARAEVAS